MDVPFHDWVAQRERKGQDKAWWEVDSIGPNTPTYGDLFLGNTRHGPMGHLGRAPEPKTSLMATAQVSSVVQVPARTKAESMSAPRSRH